MGVLLACIGELMPETKLMKDEGSGRARTRLNISYCLVGLVFLFYWGLLLLWGYRHWPTLGFGQRAFLVGMAAVYPVPAVHMTFDRRISTVMLCLSCYLALMCGVVLLGH
jgi:hypothetical protein